MLPNLNELKRKCQSLNLPVVQRGKREAKADYVTVLREHFMKRDYPMGLPFEELTPMLCFASWNLEPKELDGIWRNAEWIAQSKENGCRMTLYFVPGIGVFGTSRTVSLKTYRLQELTGKLLFSGFDKAPCHITLDCEVIVEKPVDTRPYTAKGQITKSSLHSTTALLSLEDNNSKKCQRDQEAPLKFKVIDITQWGGADLRAQPLRTRLAAVQEFFSFIRSTELADTFIELEYTNVNKQEYLKSIWDKGGEGVILKNMRATYEDSTSRRRDAWVKVKKRIEYDAFITGFKRGEAGSGFENMVGALEFSVNLTNGKTHVIGYPINMTLEERKRISVYDESTGQVDMIPEYYGRVAEISGQDISARELRLSHCTLDRFRDQPGDMKTAEECVVDMADLVAASDWVG